MFVGADLPAGIDRDHHFAHDHFGRFPKDVSALLTNRQIAPRSQQSSHPCAATAPLRMNTHHHPIGEGRRSGVAIWLAAQRIARALPALPTRPQIALSAGIDRRLHLMHRHHGRIGQPHAGEIG